LLIQIFLEILDGLIRLVFALVTCMGVQRRKNVEIPLAAVYPVLHFGEVQIGSAKALE
jgi:hypothetical protein